MRETNQDFAAWIESEKMAEKKIKKVSASAASRWVLELDVKKQWLNYSEEAVIIDIVIVNYAASKD